MPSSACCARLPSNENGRVTTPTVIAPISCASLGDGRRPACARAAPSPAVTKTMSAPFSASFSSSLLSARQPSRPPGWRCAEPPRTLGPDLDLHVGVRHQERLRIGVDRDELDAAETCVDHAVDGAGAAATDTGDFQDCQEFAGRIAHVHWD